MGICLEKHEISELSVCLNTAARRTQNGNDRRRELRAMYVRLEKRRYWVEDVQNLKTPYICFLWMLNLMDVGTTPHLLLLLNRSWYNLLERGDHFGGLLDRS